MTSHRKFILFVSFGSDFLYFILICIPFLRFFLSFLISVHFLHFLISSQLLLGIGSKGDLAFSVLFQEKILLVWISSLLWKAHFDLHSVSSVFMCVFFAAFDFFTVFVGNLLARTISFLCSFSGDFDLHSVSFVLFSQISVDFCCF